MIRFTCVSLFHYKISLLFFRFFSLLFTSNFSLRFTWVIFASKQNKAKRNSSLFFRFFHFFSLFFAFFRIFLLFLLFFALNFSLCFDLVIFASKRNKAKRNSSLFFCFFALFFHFFSLFLLFFTFFRLIFVSKLGFFHLIFAYFTFVFASDFWCFATKWIMWNQAFFSLRSETKFSLQFQISLLKWKWGCTLFGTTCWRERGEWGGQEPNHRTSEKARSSINNLHSLACAIPVSRLNGLIH